MVPNQLMIEILQVRDFRLKRIKLLLVLEILLSLLLLKSSFFIAKAQDHHFMFLPLLLNSGTKSVDLSSQLPNLVVRQVHGPQYVWERLCLLRFNNIEPRNALALFNLFDLRNRLRALLCTLESCCFLCIALNALRGLLMVVVHMLFNRVGLGQFV